MSTKAPHIASLTPLRGIAAVLVIFYHADSLLRAQHLGRLVYGTGFFARGYLWVDFFFVLSGFIITHVYGSRFTLNISTPALRDYLLARFARLYPLYFFALGVTIVLFIAVLHRMPNSAIFYSWKTLPFHFLMLLGFHLVPMGWNVPAWSIGAEWWTYLLALPLFRFLNRGVSARVFVLPMLCVAGLYALVFFHPRHVLDITFDFGLLRCVLDFVIGICVYQFYRARWQARFLATDGAFAMAALLTFALLHFAAPGDAPANAHGFASPVPSPFAPVLDALSPLVFANMILCASLNVNRARHLLNARPLQYLGDISYSIYMMQGTALVIFFVGCGVWRQSHPVGSIDSVTKMAIVGTTVVVDLLIASATYRWIEIPARVWLRRKFTPANATFDGEHNFNS